MPRHKATGSKDRDEAAPDILWKEMITRLFPDFLRFYKPDLHAEVLDEKTVFLDKEMLSVTASRHKGVVDVLAKVFLRDGSTEFVLLHVEVQGYHRRDFPRRIFRYVIRIWDKYQVPVTTLAIITPGFGKRSVESSFGFEAFGTRMAFEYAVCDLRVTAYEDCLRSDNPVAVASAIVAGRTSATLWRRKIEVLRRLSRLGLSPAMRHLLFTYVDRMAPLRGDALERFEAVAASEEKEVGMILASYEEKALKKGEKKGIEKGIEKGKCADARKMIEEGCDDAFIRRITGLSLAKIRQLRDKGRVE